jgi:hypothetical protein
MKSLFDWINFKDIKETEHRQWLKGEFNLMFSQDSGIMKLPGRSEISTFNTMPRHKQKYALEIQGQFTKRFQ